MEMFTNSWLPIVSESMCCHLLEESAHSAQLTHRARLPRPVTMITKKHLEIHDVNWKNYKCELIGGWAIHRKVNNLWVLT